MRPLATALVLAVPIAVAAWLLRETFVLAEEVGVQEGTARRHEQEAVRLSQELKAARDDGGAAVARGAADTTRLEAEVARLSRELTTMADAVRGVGEREQKRVEAAKAEQARALQPMPEGVRACLVALHECLAIEGFSDLRFLRALSLDGEGLHDVELVHASPDRLDAEILVARTMTAELDRGKGRLELAFFDGTRTCAGERAALPKDGWRIVCQPVDPRPFEARLPYLVRALGVLPEPDARRGPRPTDVDLATREEWLDRFAALLRAAGTPERVQVVRFRGIEGKDFLDASLLATDDKGGVLYGASCARLAVEVDRTAGIVSLWLRDGSLRRGVAESTISAEGYRMLLPDVTPDAAISRMLGQVVTK